MADLPRHPNSEKQTDSRLETRATVRAPRKTYLFAAIIVLVVLAMVVLHITGTVGPSTN